MPQNIMQDKVSAEYENGVLRIAVEKRPESKPQTISIK
ncbi:MAG: Hsp20 family protein, partial [Sedimentisphaerales bacterium]|nr:Hsp20 family protein [Sedimentisphaerales bacterium]